MCVYSHNDIENPRLVAQTGPTTTTSKLIKFFCGCFRKILMKNATQIFHSRIIVNSLQLSDRKMWCCRCCSRFNFVTQEWCNRFEYKLVVVNQKNLIIARK